VKQFLLFTLILGVLTGCIPTQKVPTHTVKLPKDSLLKVEKPQNKPLKWRDDIYKFNISFKTASWELDKACDEQIKKFALYLKKTGYSAEIQGHTDTQGSEFSNKRLSQKRAQAVANRLFEFGVAKHNVYAVGIGELAPIASNKTKEGRFLNRRVEAHIIKDTPLKIDGPVKYLSGSYNSGDEATIIIKKDLTFSYDRINAQGHMCFIEGKLIPYSSGLTCTLKEDRQACKIHVKQLNSDTLSFMSSGCNYWCGSGIYVKDETFKR
jgi:outer membrane protein OmpA-like peptidoglycan-associated protein